MINFLMAVVIGVLLGGSPIKYSEKEVPAQVGTSIIEYDNTKGFLSAYGKMPTDGTIAYHQDAKSIPDDLSPYDGVIAVMNCGDVGREARLIVGDEVFNVMIFDCAGIEDGGADWMIGKDRGYSYVAEIGYYMWQKYPHILGKHATIVYGDRPK